MANLGQTKRYTRTKVGISRVVLWVVKSFSAIEETQMTAFARHVATMLVLGACASPAHAGWEGTRWGMSPEDALTSLDGAQRHKPQAGEVYEYDGARYAPLVKVDHQMGSVSGVASLLFDGKNALQFVTFSPAAIGQCDVLGKVLVERHGETPNTGFGKTAIYNWTEDGDTIRFTNAPDIGICNLSYSAK